MPKSKITASIPWQRYYSTAHVAAAAGFRTSEVICDHCGQSTTCHRDHFGNWCIACEEE
jgi:hypothetical protein